MCKSQTLLPVIMECVVGKAVEVPTRSADKSYRLEAPSVGTRAAFRYVE